MAENTYDSSGFNMVHLGRGKAIVGISCSATSDGGTLTMGFKRITGIGYGVIDAAVDVDTSIAAFGVSGGVLTVYNGKVGAYAGTTDAMHFIVMGDLF